MSARHAPRHALFCALLACSAGVHAQAPGAAASTPRAGLESRQNQKIERIRHEDAGARIDEVRYGGQTQSITVTPKADVPAYEIQPPDLARTRPADHRDGLGEARGQRFWNVLRF